MSQVVVLPSGVPPRGTTGSLVGSTSHVGVYRVITRGFVGTRISAVRFRQRNGDCACSAMGVLGRVCPGSGFTFMYNKSVLVCFSG